MRLSTLLEDYKPVYPPSRLWADTFELFENSPADMAVIKDLIDDYHQNGSFREPIILSTHEEDYDEEEDFYEPYVKNGTHRVYAYHLMGVEEVYVQHGWQEPNHEDIYDENYSLYPQTITYMNIPELTSNNDLFEKLTDWFRSIRINRHFWITADLQSSNGNNFMVYWNGLELDDKKLEHVNTIILKRLKDLHITTTAVKTVTVNSEEEENREEQLL